MLVYCWVNVGDGSSTFNQRKSVWCLQGDTPEDGSTNPLGLTEKEPPVTIIYVFSILYYNFTSQISNMLKVNMVNQSERIKNS